MSTYKHLLFDLDHTLWDFEKNSEETLEELFHEFKLSELGEITSSTFIEKYKATNKEIWKLYNESKITKEVLRDIRFEMVLQEFGVCKTKVPLGIGEAYLTRCPVKPHLVPYTLEVLAYLQSKYTLHILTNGFEATQALKLSTTKLKDFFKEVVTSENSGFKKPHKEIFDFTLSRIQAPCHECLMIGDNLETDIAGARNAGIDTVFFNVDKLEHKEPVTYEIKCLSELMEIL
jgi:putative hydrolase of the HAD superfamily